MTILVAVDMRISALRRSFAAKCVVEKSVRSKRRGMIAAARKSRDHCELKKPQGQVNDILVC